MSDLGRRLLEASYLEGDFLLRSGRRSRFYLDKYLFSAQPDLLREAGLEVSTLLCVVDREEGGRHCVPAAPPASRSHARRRPARADST